MICSPVLSEADTDALFEGYSARAEMVQSRLIADEFKRLLASPGTVKPARVLASLVAMGVIDLQLAWVSSSAGARSQRLFHDKVGLFRDAVGDVVAFKGSMNETWAGLSMDGNLESVDVFLSWEGEREQARVENEVAYFERLWGGSFPGVDIRPLSEVARDEIISGADIDGWEEIVDDLCAEILAGERWAFESHKDNRIPRPHQVAALNEWANRGRRGILKHATGSGKTFTALCAIHDSVERGEVPLILVPSELLLEQWAVELKETLELRGIRLLKCGGGNTSWKNNEHLRLWTRPFLPGSPRVVLATMQTASSSAFRQLCSDGSHLFMVADEVHRLGAPESLKLLALETGPRMGLSATPERAGDPEGTNALFGYFNGVVPPPFMLDDAIAAGALTPYAYHIHRISLSKLEQEKWSELSSEIGKLYAQSENARDPNPSISRLLKIKLVIRARIIKSAEEKGAAAVRVLAENYKKGSRWIVYCDDRNQLNNTLRGIREVIDAGVYEYHSAMGGDRSHTLDLFDRAGGVVVSIRCLDEGVDIPSVDSALILASSKNPREYIQRRGRVLRRYKGKSVSNIHDVLVTPALVPGEHASTSIVEGEIVRAIEFGRSAINPSCVTDLERMAIEFGLDFDKLRHVGIEDDSDEEQRVL